MTTGKPNFIVIDDNKVDCFIAGRIIKNSGKSGQCLVFYQATEALEYIKSLPVQSVRTIVFLDIQMPVMTGFGFIEAFERLPAENQKPFHIYALSSSINDRDRIKIQSFASVKGFLGKPLTHQMINDVLNDQS